MKNKQTQLKITHLVSVRGRTIRPIQENKEIPRQDGGKKIQQRTPKRGKEIQGVSLLPGKVLCLPLCLTRSWK